MPDFDTLLPTQRQAKLHERGGGVDPLGRDAQRISDIRRSTQQRFGQLCRLSIVGSVLHSDDVYITKSDGQSTRAAAGSRPDDEQAERHSSILEDGTESAKCGLELFELHCHTSSITTRFTHL